MKRAINVSISIIIHCGNGNYLEGSKKQAVVAYEVLVKEKVFVAGAELDDACRVVGGRSDYRLSVRSLEVRLYHLEIFAIAQRHAPNLRTFVPETDTSTVQYKYSTYRYSIYRHRQSIE